MRVVRLLGICLIAAVAVAGCSKREDLKLAQIKDRTITVGDFEEAYAKIDAEYLPKATGLDGMKEFLTNLVNKDVMAEKADELGYDKDPTVVAGLDQFRRMSLPVAYLKKQVADQITVSEDEIKEYYDNMGITLSVKQLLVDTEPQSEEAYKALQDGMDFDTACRSFSKSDDASSGGQVLTVAFGRLVPELQTPLFRLPVGGYTEPIYTAQGWIIVKVLKRSDPVQKDPYDQVHDDLKTRIRSLNEAVALNKFTDKLRDQYGVEWNYENIGLVFNALPPDRSFDDAPPRSEEIYPLLMFDPKDYDRPLVTYSGKTITVKDFSDFYDQASFFARPRRAYRYGGIRTFLTERIMNEISADVVRKSNIEQDPEVAEVLKNKKEQLMVGALYEDMVNKQIVVTQQDMQTYYNDNIEAFRVPEKRKFGLVLTGDMDTARRAYSEIKSGKPFRTVALAYSIDEDTKESMGETRELAKGENPEIDAVGFSLQKVGDVSEPFQTSRGWMVLKLTERSDARTYSMDEVRGRVQAAMKEIKANQRLDELLTKWKEEYSVVVNEQNLDKVELPDRSAASPAAASGSRPVRS